MDSKFLRLLLGQSMEDEGKKKSDEEHEGGDSDSPEEDRESDTTGKNTDTRGEDSKERKEKISESVSTAGEAVGRAPETYGELREEWKKDQVPFYFMIYSTIACGGLLYIMYINRMKLFIGLFGVYALTILPILYVYEETILFSPEQNEYLRNQQTEEADQDSPSNNTESSDNIESGSD